MQSNFKTSLGPRLPPLPPPLSYNRTSTARPDTGPPSNPIHTPRGRPGSPPQSSGPVALVRPAPHVPVAPLHRVCLASPRQVPRPLRNPSRLSGAAAPTYVRPFPRAGTALGVRQPTPRYLFVPASRCRRRQPGDLFCLPWRQSATFALFLPLYCFWWPFSAPRSGGCTFSDLV